MLDQQVTVQGIVTLLQDGLGLYVEELDSDQDDGTSNALFIQATSWPDGIAQGAMISAQGKVSEIDNGRYTVTALTGLTALTQCSAGHSLPITDVSFPLSGHGREALESMRIHLTMSLTVTDIYRFNRGQLAVSGNGFQFMATEVMAPGKATTEYINQNRSFTMPATLPGNLTGNTVLASGSKIHSMTGVLAHDGRGLRLSMESLAASHIPKFSPPPAVSKNSLRVVSMNLLNYFNGDGKGHGFPTPRGAKTLAGFMAQRGRFSAAIQVLDPHILAVMELENDGFGPASAAADFIKLAQKATGHEWQAVRLPQGKLGTDKIRVGLFYRSDMVTTIGDAYTLIGAEFKKSRQPLAQVFASTGGGKKILVVVNHLKSKGSCPDDGENRNQRDGQGCWNPLRVASARKMSAWVNSLAVSQKSANSLILGDMNAYRLEDPIDVIRQAGFTELMDTGSSDTDANRPYSYLYAGQAGTIDYAFASAELLPLVQQAFIWNVNATLPAGVELPQPWLRFSDHDPVVVDIRLVQSATSD